MRKKMNPVLSGAGIGLGLAVTVYSGLMLSPKFNSRAASEASPEAGFPVASRSKAIEAIINLGRDNQFVFLGDSDHKKISIRDFIFRPDMADALADAGFRFVAVEYLTAYQPLIDALAQGKISKRNFVTTFQVFTNGYSIEQGSHLESDADKLRSVESFADFVIAANKQNIHIIAADGREGYSEDFRATLPHVSERAMAFTKFLQSVPEIYARDTAAVLNGIGIEKLPNEEKAREFIDESSRMPFYAFAGRVHAAWSIANYHDDLLDEHKKAVASGPEVDNIFKRLEQDGEVAARIKAQTGDHKTLVIYGLAHSYHRMGNLAKKLNNAPTLMMVETPADYGAIVNNCTTLARLAAACEIKDRHYIFAFREGFVFKAGELSRESLMKPEAPARQ